MLSTFAVIDFETTGLSPALGDRVTEVGVVILANGRIVDRFQSLVNPRRPIPLYVQSLTGITDAMVRGAPDAASVMQTLNRFVGSTPYIAHNAAFDRKFLDAEFATAGLQRRAEVACSLMLARRLYQNAPNHQLGTLVRCLSLPSQGQYHRALADAEMTAHLVLRMIDDLHTRHGIEQISHEVLCKLQGVPKLKFADALSKFKSATATPQQQAE